MTLYILPYKKYSASALLLAKKLMIRRIGEKDLERVRPNDLIINWGKSVVETDIQLNYKNKPERVNTAVHKIDTWKCIAEKLSPNLVPEWTKQREVALRWLEDNYKVYARHTEIGHSGRGIEVINPEEPLPNALFYTKNIANKRYEYRIHVFDGTVIDFQQKKRSTSHENTNYDIRSHQNGWVFCREKVEIPPSVMKIALEVMGILGLDFGAVDISYVNRTGEIKVLEINTAPGLTGTTLESYSSQFKRYL